MAVSTHSVAGGTAVTSTLAGSVFGPLGVSSTTLAGSSTLIASGPNIGLTRTANAALAASSTLAGAVFGPLDAGVNTLSASSISTVGNPSLTWSPLNLPGINAFWRADVGVNVSGSNVTSWNDQTGNHFLGLPSATAPTWSATSFNSSFPGVSYTSGTSCYVEQNGTNYNPTTFSFFYLAMVPVSNSNSFRHFQLPSNTPSDSVSPGISIVNDGTIFATSSGNITGSFAYTANTPYFFGFTLNGTTAFGYGNNSTPMISAGTAFSSSVGGTTTSVVLGGNSSSFAHNSDRFVVAVAIMTLSALNQTNISNLIFWCNATFGTSIYGGAAGIAGSASVGRAANATLAASSTSSAKGPAVGLGLAANAVLSSSSSLNVSSINAIAISALLIGSSSVTATAGLSLTMSAVLAGAGSLFGDATVSGGGGAGDLDRTTRFVANVQTFLMRGGKR